MNRRAQNIAFFIILSIACLVVGYAVYTKFIASDEFYEDCSNCYKDGHRRHWKFDK